MIRKPSMDGYKPVVSNSNGVNSNPTLDLSNTDTFSF